MGQNAFRPWCHMNLYKMGVSSTYGEKLKDPQWQKKRLEILNRDQFTCQLCSDETTELQVHHLSYEYGKEPWEYPNENFVTYCRFCHKLIEHFKSSSFKPVIATRMYKNQLFLICIVHNNENGNSGVSIKYLNEFDELCNLIDLSEDAINTVSKLFDLSKNKLNAKNTNS